MVMSKRWGFIGTFVPLSRLDLLRSFNLAILELPLALFLSLKSYFLF